MSTSTDNVIESAPKVKQRRARPHPTLASAVSIARGSVPWSDDSLDILERAGERIGPAILDEKLTRETALREISAVVRAALGDAQADEKEQTIADAVSIGIDKIAHEHGAEIRACTVAPDEHQPEWLGEGFVASGGAIFRVVGRKVGSKWVEAHRRVCGPIVIDTRYRDGSEVGYAIDVLDERTGIWRQFCFPAGGAELNPATLSKAACDAGMTSPTDAENRDRKTDLVDLMKSARTTRNVRLVRTTGWHDDIFVLPDAQFGPEVGEPPQLQSTGAHHFNVAGDFATWQERVARRALGNDLLVMVLSAAAAGPFVAGQSNLAGIIHVVGPSSCGKTTALHVAGSFCGGSKDRLGYAESWDKTSNALLGRAALYSDSLMCLDELGTANDRDVASALYRLSGGVGRDRQRRSVRGTIEMAEQDRFNVLVLSTGEVSIEEKIAGAGIEIRGGQDVRAINIVIDPDGGMPALAAFHDCKDGAAFSRSLVEAARASHGHALRKHLEAIAVGSPDTALNGRAGAFRWVGLKAKDWLKTYAAGVTEGEIVRIAERFAAIAAAGEFAIAVSEVFPWPRGTAFEAVGRVFAKWLAHRGSVAPKDILVGTDRIRSFVVRHDANFEVHESGVIRQAHGKRIGWRFSHDGLDVYGIPLETLKAELKGLRVHDTIRELQKQAHILPGTGDGPTTQVTLGRDRRRLVLITDDWVNG